MTGRAEEHWFDRLAEPHTRRTGFKAALAGAVAAAAGSLWRADSAAAQAVPCYLPCLFEAQVGNARRESACNAALGGGAFGGIVSGFLINPVIGTVQLGNATLDALECHEKNAYRSKAQHYDCLQPGCSGYSPDPRVLCPGCLEAGGKCCPDPATTYQAKHTCCACCRAEGGCTACG